MASELDKVKADLKQVSDDNSELNRQLELRSRELNSERKRAARVAELEEERDGFREDADELRRQLLAAQNELADAQSHIEELERQQADLEAARRLFK